MDVKYIEIIHKWKSMVNVSSSSGHATFSIFGAIHRINSERPNCENHTRYRLHMQMKACKHAASNWRKKEKKETRRDGGWGRKVSAFNLTELSASLLAWDWHLKKCWRQNGQQQQQQIHMDNSSSYYTVTRKNKNNLVKGEIAPCLYSPRGSIRLMIWPQFAIACFSWRFYTQFFSLLGVCT